MCGLAFGHPSPPPCPHRDWSVQRKERDFSVSVCDFAPKPGILSLCLCLVPISRAQRSHLLPLCSGTTWPHTEVCVPHSWDTSRLFWPDCPWQWVCRCRWLMASVPPLPCGLDLRAAQVSDSGGPKELTLGLSTAGRKCPCWEP